MEGEGVGVVKHSCFSVYLFISCILILLIANHCCQSQSACSLKRYFKSQESDFPGSLEFRDQTQATAEDSDSVHTLTSEPHDRLFLILVIWGIYFRRIKVG